MNHHHGVLQERRQSIPVCARHQVHRSIRTRHRQRLERASHKIVQRQKENLHAGHHHADVGHQFAILVPVRDEHGKNVNREEETPEEQRSFLPRPERCNLVKRREVAIAVRNDVGVREIVAEKQVLEAECREENQAAGGDSCLPWAFDQKRMTRDNRANPSGACIHRANKC